MEKEFVSLISQVGIPAAITFLLIVRLEKVLGRLERAVSKQTAVLAALLVKLDADEEARAILKDNSNDKEKIAI